MKNKSLESLKRIETVFPLNRENKPNYYSQFTQSAAPFYEDFDLVEKELKAFDIIKEKQVYIKDILECDTLYEYNYLQVYDYKWLSKQEFKLLKEVI